MSIYVNICSMSWLVLTCSDCRAGRCVSTWEHATHVTSTSAGNFRVSDGGFVVAFLGIVNCRNVAMTCNDHCPACFVWRNLRAQVGAKTALCLQFGTLLPELWTWRSPISHLGIPMVNSFCLPGALGIFNRCIEGSHRSAKRMGEGVHFVEECGCQEVKKHVKNQHCPNNPWDWYIHLQSPTWKP